MAWKYYLCVHLEEFQRSSSLLLSIMSLTFALLDLSFYGGLKERRYWNELYCRSALKMIPCVKISEAITLDEVDGRWLVCSQRRTLPCFLLLCVRPGSHLQHAQYISSRHESMWECWQHYSCMHAEITLSDLVRSQVRLKDKQHALLKYITAKLFFRPWRAHRLLIKQFFFKYFCCKNAVSSTRNGCFLFTRHLRNRVTSQHSSNGIHHKFVTLHDTKNGFAQSVHGHALQAAAKNCSTILWVWK